jgi:ABC-type polysaccharide/polyol phosphate export permease
VIEEARGLWAYRNLIVEMAIRDIKIRYKRSVLGVFWTMLAPLLNMVALTLVFSHL